MKILTLPPQILMKLGILVHCDPTTSNSNFWTNRTSRSEDMDPQIFGFSAKRGGPPTFDPHYLRNYWTNLHKSCTIGRGIAWGFQICPHFSNWRRFGYIDLLTFPMTLKLTLWDTWPWDDLSLNFISYMLTLTYQSFRGVIFFVLLQYWF